MIGFQFDLTRFTTELGHLSKNIEEILHVTVKDAGIYGRDQARNTKLFKNNGPLREATNFVQTGRLSGFIEANKSYAVFLEEGNPYQGFQITPKHGKVLHFVIDGKDVFTKHSTAHGPLPFMKEAAEATELEIENIFDRNFERMIK